MGDTSVATTRRGSEIDMKKAKKYARGAMDANQFAVPFHRQNIWKKARRNAPDHFRMMRSVWNAPWFTSENSRLKNFISSMAKAGRLAWMSVGAIPAGATFLLQSIAKPSSWAGKAAFRKGGIWLKSRNPFKMIGGACLYALGGIAKLPDYLLVKPVCMLSGFITRYTFDSRLNPRYGIQSAKPIDEDTLKTAAKKIVDDQGKLEGLTKALNYRDFKKRKLQVSKVMKGALDDRSDDTVQFSDENIGQFLFKVKSQLKESEKLEESRRLVDTGSAITYR